MSEPRIILQNSKLFSDVWKLSGVSRLKKIEGGAGCKCVG